MNTCLDFEIPLLEYVSRIRIDIAKSTKKDHSEILQLIESRYDLWTAPLDVTRMAGFMLYARLPDDLQVAESRLDRYAALIRKMKEAHSVLATKPDIAAQRMSSRWRSLAS